MWSRFKMWFDLSRNIIDEACTTAISQLIENEKLTCQTCGIAHCRAGDFAAGFLQGSRVRKLAADQPYSPLNDRGNSIYSLSILMTHLALWSSPFRQQDVKGLDASPPAAHSSTLRRKNSPLDLAATGNACLTRLVCTASHLPPTHVDWA